MRFRVAITALLSVFACALLSVSPAAFAAAGDTPSAVAAQYGSPDAGDVAHGDDEGGVAPGGDAGDQAPAGAGGNAIQAPRQDANLGGQAGQSGIPFTGYAVIPLMFIGLALLAGGLMLRGGPQRTQQV